METSCTNPEAQALPAEETPAANDTSLSAPTPRVVSISPAKLAANRRNAQRSTGPRTARGKANSRRNALKHGLLAKEVLIGFGPGRESRAEFEGLLCDLQDDLAPVGKLEEMLVEQIVSSAWRLRRVYRFEEGQIRSRLGNADREVVTRRRELGVLDKIMLEHRPVPNWDDPKEFEQFHKWARDTESDRQLIRETTEDLAFLTDLLLQVRGEVERAGCVSRTWLEKLFKYFGADQGGIARTIVRLQQASPSVEQTAPVPAADADSNAQAEAMLARLQAASKPAVSMSQAAQEKILALLDAEAAGLRAQRATRARRERQLAKASLAKLSLPPPPASEQILRYEAAIEREYYRALHELERLQRRRQGEFVPPPVSAQLSVAGDEAPRGGETID